MATRGEALTGPVEAVIEKDLIHNQRQSLLTAKFFQRDSLTGLGEMTCGIVWVDHRNRSGARGHPPAQRLQVQMPAVIVEKLIRDQPHVVQPGQEVEQRVARLANQHLVPRIAEQPEEEAVGLAGAGSEKDLFRIY